VPTVGLQRISHDGWEEEQHHENVAETARRGRPRRATRSTYATTRHEDSKDEQPVQDQLLSLQQERDRVAAASQ